jgi:large subunit ribosomal protein L5
MATPKRPAIPRLKERYRAEIAPALKEQFGYANVMQIPGLVKIVVNMGVGEAARDAKLIDGAVRDLATITGQRPAVAQGEEVRRAVQAARGHADRRARDAARRPDVGVPRPAADHRAAPYPRLPRPVPRQFDGRGNYTFGLTEQVMFHEIDPDKVDRQRGMDITVVTTATNDAEGRSLLRRLGFPFKEG